MELMEKVFPFVEVNESGQLYTGMALDNNCAYSAINVNQVLKITTSDQIKFAFSVGAECYFIGGASGIISMKLLSRL